MSRERPPAHDGRWRPVIGIVGGIGSGKSAVARAFADLGCVVCHSDDLARAVLAEPEVVQAIVDRMGSGVLEPGGAIDRGALARAIFADPSARAAVEAVMHPRIEARRRAQFAAAPDSAPALVIDAPLLLEVGLDRECDAVVLVDAPSEVRRARVGARGWSPEEHARRESAQWPIERKAARATDTIDNSGPPEAIAAQVHSVLGAVVARGPRTADGDDAAPPAPST